MGLPYIDYIKKDREKKQKMILYHIGVFYVKYHTAVIL